MHSIRLLTSAIEILRTGDFSTFRPNREFLIECRSGKFSFEEALQLIENYDQELKDAVHVSSIPERPDYETVNKLLIELNEEALDL
ncbi:hypothetical protein [Bacillus aerius]|uniref:hypothetical protein n=1 Tax=Bacillus aerius TaxID=293388 RepID=UPI003450C9E5